MGRTEYGSMKITTARFYRINGSSTQVRGVSSDIVLPSYLDVLDIGEDKLPNALPWTRIEPLPYANAWNMKTLVDRLKAASCARLAKDEKWENHLKAVALFKNSADRLYVPLDKEGRKAVMRDDRIMRDLEDGDTDNEDEDEKSLTRRSKRNRIKKDDPVLAEAFNILFDIVNLENGKEAPLPKEPEVPAWMKLLQ